MPGGADVFKAIFTGKELKNPKYDRRGSIRPERAKNSSKFDENDKDSQPENTENLTPEEIAENQRQKREDKKLHRRRVRQHKKNLGTESKRIWLP